MSTSGSSGLQSAQRPRGRTIRDLAATAGILALLVCAGFALPLLFSLAGALR